MKVKSTRFGPIEVDEERLLRFPRGLLGFPDQSEYALLQTNNEGNFFWLQSVERPEVAFVVCDPGLFVPEYRIELKPEECEQLGMQDMDSAQVLVIVNKVDRVLTGNLQGPLVINAINRQGLQMVICDKRYGTRHQLIDLEAVRQEVSLTA